MAEHEHDDHEHGELHYLSTEVTDGAIAQVRETHPALAEALDLSRRWATLTDDEKKSVPEKQVAVEQAEGWMPGYHSEGDKCATCGMPTLPLFADKLQEGELPYAAFLHGLPVHATKACLDGFFPKVRDVSPRGIDKARRGLMRDLERPTSKMSQFFRHDLFAHPPFNLEDWADSVASANPAGLGRQSMKDIDRLLRWVHQRLFHH